MPPKRSKIVTLKLSSEKLETFPDLVNHQQDKKQKIKLMLKSKNGEPESRSNSLKPPGSHDSQSPSVGPNVINQSKYAPIVRVGISGLTMNSQIVREIDVSDKKPGKWEKLGKKEKSAESTKAEGAGVTSSAMTVKPKSKKIKFTVEDLDTNPGVLSMKDVRGFKTHPEKAEQIRIIEEAEARGRRVVQSFSGYVMLWPSWHKVKEGNLEKKPEYSADKERGGFPKGAGTKKSNGIKSLASSEVPTRPDTPLEGAASVAPSAELGIETPIQLQTS